MYDFAHGQSDYFERVTHSLCTLDFEVHRPLYDWLVEHLMTNDYRPRQTEFNRLNLNYTVHSKRVLLNLVKEGHVKGWDDPRMPTLCGLGRRGYTPESIRNFNDSIGYTKVMATNDVGLLEFAVRENLNKRAPRIMAVLDPLKLIITNYPGERTEEMETINNPEDESMGSRTNPFSSRNGKGNRILDIFSRPSYLLMVTPIDLMGPPMGGYIFLILTVAFRISFISV